MAITKFKIGDKVRILPSAVNVNVAQSEIGKIGVITIVYSGGDCILKTASKKYSDWWVRGIDITPAMIKGQQLLFSFME